MLEAAGNKRARGPRSTSNPILGPVATLVTAALMGFIAYSGLDVYNPVPVLILPVIFSAMQGGLRVGFISAALASLYFAFYYSLPGELFRYSQESLWHVAVWSLTALGLVPLIWYLQKQHKGTTGAADWIRAHLAERDVAGEIVLKREEVLLPIVEQALDSMSVLDSQGVFRSISICTHTILGYAPGELLGKTSFDYIHSDDVPRARQVLGQAQVSGVLDPMTVRMRCKDDSWKMLKIKGRTMDHGGERLVIIHSQDVTDRRHSEALIAAEKNLFEMIVKDRPLTEVLDALVRAIEEQSIGMLCAVLLLDEDGLHLRHGAAPSLPDDFNKAFDGLAIGPQTGSSGTAAFLRRLVVVEDIATNPLWAPFKDIAAQHGLRAAWSQPIMSAAYKVLGTFTAYYREPKSPKLRDVEIIERVANFAAIAIERKQAQTQVEHMAHFDALTNLPNRTLMLDRLNQALLQARRNKRGVALFFIDLDNFKEVNDSLGHAIGDAVLCAVAERMVHCVRQGDTVSRQGGDEFVIILPNIQQSEDTRQVAQKILDAFAVPFAVSGRDFVITASIGISFFPENGQDAQTLMINADSAMYRAKEQGRNKYQFYGSR
jgi:diguanylate cyclase (GGDEF)-like protein/PAS domain S-box-containing protein